MSGSYFDPHEDEMSAGPVRVTRAPELRRFPVSEGIAIEPVLGERLNVNVVRLDPRAVATVHAHREEQIGFVVSGSCEFTDGRATWTLRPGDSYYAPAGAPHGARAFDGGCVILDAFAPPRAGVRELLEG